MLYLFISVCFGCTWCFPCCFYYVGVFLSIKLLYMGAIWCCLAAKGNKELLVTWIIKQVHTVSLANNWYLSSHCYSQSFTIFSWIDSLTCDLPQKLKARHIHWTWLQIQLLNLSMAMKIEQFFLSVVQMLWKHFKRRYNSLLQQKVNLITRQINYF